MSEIAETATSAAGDTTDDEKEHEQQQMLESSQEDTDADDAGSHYSSPTTGTGESSGNERSGSTTSGSNVSSARARKPKPGKHFSATTRIAVEQLDEERERDSDELLPTENPTFASMRSDQLPGDGDKMDKMLCQYLESLPKPQTVQRIECPPMYNTTHDTILDYIGHHNLEALLEHLLALCLITMPDEPFEFIAHHCGQMIQARTNPEKYKELTRLFYPKHVHAMWRVFDKEQNGHISFNQYKFAMQALGLTRYTVEPKGYRMGAITEETFTHEACHALEVLLKSFMA